MVSSWIRWLDRSMAAGAVVDETFGYWMSILWHITTKFSQQKQLDTWCNGIAVTFGAPRSNICSWLEGAALTLRHSSLCVTYYDISTQAMGLALAGESQCMHYTPLTAKNVHYCKCHIVCRIDPQLCCSRSWVKDTPRAVTCQLASRLAGRWSNISSPVLAKDRPLFLFEDQTVVTQKSGHSISAVVASIRWMTLKGRTLWV